MYTEGPRVGYSKKLRGVVLWTGTVGNRTLENVPATIMMGRSTKPAFPTKSAAVGVLVTPAFWIFLEFGSFPSSGCGEPYMRAELPGPYDQAPHRVCSHIKRLFWYKFAFKSEGILRCQYDFTFEYVGQT